MSACITTFNINISHTHDTPRWDPDRALGFSIKSSYDWLRRGLALAALTCESPSRIWSPKVPRKIKIFTWLLAHERLRTKVYQAKWCEAEQVLCALCGDEPETAAHLFCQCRVTQALWRVVGAATSLDPFQSLTEMWEAGARLHSMSRPGASKYLARLVIPAGTWVIWRTRNDAVFKGARVYVENMWALASVLIQDWARDIVGVRGARFGGGVIEAIL
ncbi:hypothetical protein QJS10_CPB13g01036 [Acorus calamus]|uniref:Reverse transcriptase zinc-binding domain-containing protein n=1 Tax=Acorus calamus TaxID=4465 RepID=A0AAV9DGR4_ACOCL|nr:hypothetical protein QJS10_CPB13g01036 [Acorus calamus]